MPPKDNLKNNFSIRHREVLISLFLVLVTFAVYFQVRQFDFVIYDDDDYVTANRHVQEGLSPDALIWAFTTVHASNWHPLTWLSHMADCQFFGLNPGMHHLTNLLFHIANTLLLFLVFRKMTGSLWQSAFIAALFALHPLHVQSVAWVSERKDVLSAFFWFAPMGFYVRYTRHPTICRYSLIVLAFILGLISKPMLVTLPLVLLLLDYWPLNRFGFQQHSKHLYLVWEKIPLLILATISSGVTFYAQSHGGSVKSLDLIPLKARIANAAVSYVTYIGKMLYPSNLAAFYPYNGLPSWKVIAALLLLVSISLLAILTKKQRPYFIVGWLWFLGTLIPVIGLVQVGAQSMADRYTYIPLIGLFIIIAWGVPELMEQLKHKKIWLAASATLTLSIFTAVTWNQIGYWKNSITLFEHALEVTTRNDIAHYNLGVALAGVGRIDEAITHYYEALDINPNQPQIHVNLGIALDERGNHNKALFHFRKAVSLDPKNDQAQYNLGTALLKKGNLDKAILHLQKAAALKPNSDKAQYNLGDAFFRKKQYENALLHLQKAIGLNPKHYKAQQLLGAILFEKGKIKEAEKHFKQILRHNPGSAEVYNYLGAISLKQKKIYKASNYFKTALKYDPSNEEAQKNLEQLQTKLKEAEQSVIKDLTIAPDNPYLYYQLGKIYQSQGMLDKAIQQYKKVISLRPQSIDALYSLATLCAKQRNYNTAISYLQKIISYQPNNPTHYYNVACMYAKQNKIKTSIDWLKKALDKGYLNWEQIKTDEDLKRIRTTTGFKQLIEKYQ